MKVLVRLRGVNVSLEERAYCLLDDGVDARLLVLIYFVQADVVLSVAGVAEFRHADGSYGKW